MNVYIKILFLFVLFCKHVFIVMCTFIMLKHVTESNPSLWRSLAINRVTVHIRHNPLYLHHRHLPFINTFLLV